MKELKMRRKLIAYIMLKGKDRNKLAEKLGIKPRTFNTKLNGISDFTVKEIEILKEELGIEASEVYEMFIA